jgi:hypothetical protein
MAESNDSALESGFFKPLLVEIPAILQSGNPLISQVCLTHMPS